MSTNARVSGKAAKQKVYIYRWEGLDSQKRLIKGTISAVDEKTAIRGVKESSSIVVKKIKKVNRKAKKIEPKDVAIFTRQLATMMKAGVPLLQSFDIVAKGHDNANVTDLLFDIKANIESGSTLASSFAKHPKHFNDLYVNLVAAGESAGILESVLDKLAVYQEKMMALRSKIKSAMFYPVMVIGASFLITAIIMIFVIPAFKSVFASFGADLPGPTLLVMALSEFMVAYWYLVLGAIFGAFSLFKAAYAKSVAMRNIIDIYILKMPIFGSVIEKSIIARWTGTLATMFAAGVPLVESLTSVAGASGNYLYRKATLEVQKQISTGISLSNAMTGVDLFPPMALQMTAIGEESGSLDTMLSKVSDHFQREVDDAVDALSSLMEPLIMIVLGTLVGGIVIAMYLPIFKLGAAV